MTYNKAKTISIIVTLTFIFATYSFVKYINKQAMLIKYPTIEDTSVKNTYKYDILSINDISSKYEMNNNISSYEYKVKIKENLKENDYENISKNILTDCNKVNKSKKIGRVHIYIYDKQGNKIYSFVNPQ